LDWIRLAENSVQRRGLAKKTRNLASSTKCGKLLDSLPDYNFLKMTSVPWSCSVGQWVVQSVDRYEDRLVGRDCLAD
jgi:hypothetical protein